MPEVLHTNTLVVNLVANVQDYSQVEFQSSHKYTFHQPTYMYSDNFLKMLEYKHPNFDVETMLLWASTSDRLNGLVSNPVYWEMKNFIKYDDEGKVQKGFIPTVLDESYLKLNELSMTHDTYTAPKLLPVFFAVNNVKGKFETIWTLLDQTDPLNVQEIITIRGAPFFVWRFQKSGTYALEVTVMDTRSNLHKSFKEMAVQVLDREEYLDRIDKLFDERNSNL